jgi:hypothetical protein
MAQKRVGNQIGNLISDHYKSRITLISLRLGDVLHTVGNFLTRATILLPSSQSKVYTQSYGPLKLQESQLWEFWDSHLGVPRQNDIWVLVPWPGTKYNTRGKVVASPKSEPWWVLWIRVCPCLILAPKMLQPCSNQLVVWFVEVCVSDWLLVILPSLIPKL